MKNRKSILIALLLMFSTTASAQYRTSSELTVGGFVNPESVACDVRGKMLYVGIFALGVSGQIKKLSDPIGRLDGAYEMQDGSLLVTDWDSGSLFHRNENGETRKLADGFKGPADFCVMPQAGGLTVYLPDLVQSNLRIIQLRK